MKHLAELVENLKSVLVCELPERELNGAVSRLIYDTRAEFEENSAFVCISGASFDGHDFAAEAARKGAKYIFSEKEIGDIEGAVVIRVSDTRKALSLLSAAWFDHPAEKLTTIGLTGTKGKSTTCYMIRNILEASGRSCGIIGTIGIVIKDKTYETHNTTPESYSIQEYMRKMVDAGCDTLIMEVSSQGLKQHRTYGINFDYAVFTNLSKDHIGGAEHKDFEEYRYCKSLLFKQCKTAIVNTDDANTAYMLEGSDAKRVGFGMGSNLKEGENVRTKVLDDFCGEILKATELRLFTENGVMGIEFDYEGLLKGTARLSIPGRFNVMNALCAIAVSSHFTKDTALISESLKATHVRGRLEPVKISDKCTMLIDYAHNAMALESVLKTLREYKPKRLVCLFGCGGNRSKDRRYEMGEVSSNLSDLTVVTSDNPRYEKPEDIINDILIGVKRGDGYYITIPDRREAIKYVIDNALEGDCILLTGKGNEDYQEIEGVRYHMDEREIVADILKRG
ncbi:MAG: UDP-N-acetylmuramoyl-L-alanyl-D-glutamate--2,6-diaminopimelate ligase [Lachnospiraceae bacterium]|nr:UDP-N-acetylmuramoyl-L-alanyl-D-glutamate--2,6-diaminopimelate ligase [Lachnospiraceae bacterium]